MHGWRGRVALLHCVIDDVDLEGGPVLDGDQYAREKRGSVRALSNKSLTKIRRNYEGL